MSLWQFIALMLIAGFIIVVACQPTPERGGLTEDEFEEYEMLGSFMDWRVLSDAEQERYEELHRKYRGIANG